MEIITQLLSNSYFVWCAMAVIVFGVTQLLKLPIKLVTKKIKNERVRRSVNAVILLIPFGLGVLFEFLYSTYYLKEAFSVITGLGYGTAGISLYGVIERFFKVKVQNPYTETDEGKAVTDFVQDVVNGKDSKTATKELVADIIGNEKVEEKDNKDAVADFWKEVNK